MVMMYDNPSIHKTSLSPEFQLLLECCKQALAEKNSSKPMSFKGDIDWTAFSQLSNYHRLQPVVAHVLSMGNKAASTEFLTEMQHELRRNAVRNLLLTNELIELTMCFNKKGLRVLPYKGPMLTAVSGSSMPRQFRDLDILLHPQDLDKAKKLLEERGYHSKLELGWEHSFFREDSQIDVDLHWAFTSEQFYFPLNFEEAWAEKREVILSGLPLQTLGKEHTFLVQCVNASKDHWPFPSLDHIFDLARLIIVEDIDWYRLFRDVRRLRCEKILLLGLYLTNTLFLVPLPKSAVAPMRKHRSIFSLGKEVTFQLNARNKVMKSRVAKELFRSRIREDVRDKWPYFLNITRFLVTVNEKDYALLRLPRWLFFLYYGVRVFRLLRNHSFN
jgi:hypothetical protein